MEIQKITENKKEFLPLLLLADPEEVMLEKYLARGELYCLYDNGLKGVFVVTKEGPFLYELKNIAVPEAYHSQGYGKAMVKFLFQMYGKKGTVIQVGTGESVKTLSFYKTCGFTFSHIVPNFFTDNYKEPIFEEGKQLKDMIYLKKVFV